MLRKFKLEINFDDLRSQKELATMLHTIARNFDIDTGFVLVETKDPVEVRDINNNVVGVWTYD